MNCLASLPAVQIETIEVGFFPCIYIRGRNVEDLGFNFHNAHGRMGECEEKLGLYRLLIVRRWNIPKLVMIQNGYKDRVVGAYSQILQKIVFWKSSNRAQLDAWRFISVFHN